MLADINSVCTLSEFLTVVIQSSDPHTNRFWNPQFLAIISPETGSLAVESKAHPDFSFQFRPDIGNAAFLFLLGGLIDDKNRVTEAYF